MTAPALEGSTALDNYLRKLRPVDLDGWANHKLDGRLRDHRWREAVSPLRRVAHCNRHPITRGKAGGVPLTSIRLIARPLGEITPEGKGAAGRFAGLQRCGSVWSCPECARHLAAARVELITRAIATARRKGYGACWQTLTLPHAAPDRLATTLGLVTTAWRTISASRRWKEMRSALGIIGLFRKVEVTHGVNGWHPHAHVTFVSRRPLEESQLEDLEAFVWEAWGTVCARAGFFPPYRDFCPLYALDLDRGDGWAEYVGKMLGLEFAGTGKKAGAGRTPFELLDAAVSLAKACRGNAQAIRAAGDPALGSLADPSARLWSEYQRATRGKHQMHWSRGLKADLEVAGEGEEAEQLALADALVAEQEETVYQLTPLEWFHVSSRPERAAVLVAIAELPAPSADRRREVRRWLAHWCGLTVAELLPV